MHRVFVYGTLKVGFPYHHVMSPALLVGGCSTVERFPLLIAGEWYSPILIDEPGVGLQVRGELYEVDQSMLEALDEVEGVGRPFGYNRVEVAVRVDDVQSRAWTYVKPRSRVGLIHSAPLSEYTLDERYVPGEQRGQPNSGFGE